MTDVIDFLIDYHESVVHFRILKKLNGLILLIVGFERVYNSLLKLRVNGSLNSLCTAIKEAQDFRIHIVVYQHNSCLCHPDELLHKFICVEKLTVEQHIFIRREIRLDKKVDLPFHRVQSVILMEQFPVYPLFNVKQLLVYSVSS